MQYQRFTADIKQQFPGQTRRSEPRRYDRYYVLFRDFPVWLHGILDYVDSASDCKAEIEKERIGFVNRRPPKTPVTTQNS